MQNILMIRFYTEKIVSTTNTHYWYKEAIALYHIFKLIFYIDSINSYETNVRV